MSPKKSVNNCWPGVYTGLTSFLKPLEAAAIKKTVAAD